MSPSTRCILPGPQPGPAVSTSFISGNASMMMLSTGSLTFVRDNAKFSYKVAFIPRNVRNAVPIGGASLIVPAGLKADKQKAAWTLIKWMTSPEKSGWWSRATGYFAPNMAAYKTPDMVEFLNKNPDAKTAVEQLDVAKPWFATYKTVPVRKTLEDEVQAGAERQEAAEGRACRRPESRRRAAQALQRRDGAEAALIQGASAREAGFGAPRGGAPKASGRA